MMEVVTMSDKSLVRMYMLLDQVHSPDTSTYRSGKSKDDLSSLFLTYTPKTSTRGCPAMHNTANFAPKTKETFHGTASNCFLVSTAWFTHLPCHPLGHGNGPGMALCLKVTYLDISAGLPLPLTTDHQSCSKQAEWQIARGLSRLVT